MTDTMTFRGSLGIPKRRLKDIPYQERILSKTKNENGCFIFQGYVDELGYGRISFKGRCRLTTRVMWEVTYGKIPSKMLVCHKCDNPSCVNPEHLFLGTNKDNVQDMINKKRKVILCGDKHPRSKIGREDVVDIRNRNCTL